MALQLGGKYIQKGYRTFKKWYNKMTADFGDDIKPWASAIWETLRSYPQGVKFDEKQVTAVAKAVGVRYEKGMTDYEEIKKDFTKNLSAANKKKVEPILEASYNGIKKFFEDREAAKENGGQLGQSAVTSERYGDVETKSDGKADENKGQVKNDEGTERSTGQSGRSSERDRTADTERNADSEKSTGEDAARESRTNDSTGNGERGDQSNLQGRGRRGLNTDLKEVPGHNYRITDESGIGEGGEKTKFKQNIEAVKLLKQLESENRMATPSEQAILAKFNGWGTVASAFSNDPKWAKEREQLKELLTEEEYKAASAAITNAYYTDPKISQSIWNGLNQLGFKGGRILDPSMGSGIFFGTMPNEIAANSELTGVELDSLTGRIAKQLYQKAAIDIVGFDEKRFPNNYFDLAISNVPFGSTSIYSDPDYRKQGFHLHNFFFAKAMDKVRPGGLVAFITSTGTMQSTSADAVRLRNELSTKADLVAAFKLPSNAFDKNAKTQVTTDVLILQKRVEPHKPSANAQSWKDVIWYTDDENNSYRVNEYFKEHPEHLIGKPTRNSLWGGNDTSMALDGKGRNVVKELNSLMKKMPKDVYQPYQTPQRQSTLKNTYKVIANDNNRQGHIDEVDGKIMQKVGDEYVEVPKANQQMAKDFIKLRQVVNNLIQGELTPTVDDKKLAEMRKSMNEKYDAFVKKYGYLNSKNAVKVLGKDPAYGRVAAIEKYSEDKKTKKITAEKADIFFKRQVGAIKEPTSADNVTDALNLSIAMKGKLDLPYMAQLTGKSESEIVKELGDNVYKNPMTQLYETAEEYLSGDVRVKLAIAETAAAANPEYQRNVDALKKVQPIDMTENEIKPHIGAPWINAEVYRDFINHMVGTSNVLPTYNPTLGAWYGVEYNWNADQQKANYQWGVNSKYNFFKLLDAILNNSKITVTYKDKDGNTRTDEAATQAVQQKMEEIQDEFTKWIWTDKERTKALCEVYNVKYNSEVERKYDGSMLTFPGLASSITPYPHQKNVIRRILTGANTLIAHCVGAGKTWSMQIAAMEGKRLGLFRKPLFILPDNILKQFEAEFYRAYPNAKLLVLQSKDLPGVNMNLNFTEDIDTKEHKKELSAKAKKKAEKQNKQETKDARLAKRRATLSRIQTEDWDGIIINHNLFKSLPMSPKTYNKFYAEQLAELEAAKMEVDMGDGTYGRVSELSKRQKKELANAISNLQQKLKRDINEEAKEIVTPFEELGIDQVFVDEADLFKNLAFRTKMANMSGVSTTGSQRSLDMYVKTRYMNKQYGGHIVFATGTPISNSLNEIYTMQRYLDPDTLKQKDMTRFDRWAAMFGKKVTDIEPTPSGDGFRQIVRLVFTNLRSLSGIFRRFSDIKMFEDLPHLERPKLKNGERTIIQIEPTEAFKKFKEKLVERADAIKQRLVEPTEDNILKLTGDFRKASLDMRMVEPNTAESEAGHKISALCSEVAAKYKEFKDVKGTQLIFSDIGVSQIQAANDEISSAEDVASNESISKEGLSIYEHIKKGLIKQGIPANQIAFVHDAKNADQRQALFEKVNNGDIRVIIGSTQKMGAGTNFQKHLVALHHLDCPWRPRDIEQREGRILRKGNENKEVEIFTYVTKGSFDSNMWDKVVWKQAMIDSIMRGDPMSEEIEDISQEAANLGEIVAAAYENPLMKEQTELKSKIRKLKNLEKSHNQQQAQMRKEISDAETAIPVFEKTINNAKADIAERADTRGDNFKAKIGDKTYTDRKEAAAALSKAKTDYKDTSFGKVGEIGNFDILMKMNPVIKVQNGVTTMHRGDIDIKIANNGSYNVPTHSIQSLEATVNTAPDKVLEKTQKSLELAKEKVTSLKPKVNKPFAKADELKKAIKREEEVRKEIEKINNENANPQAVDASAENTNNDEVKWSKQGTQIAGIKEIVDTKDLTEQQKAIADFYGEQLGLPVIFFKGAKELNGATANGIVYLNVDSPINLEQTFWHEWGHVAKANDPEFFSELIDSAEITKEQCDDYRERTKRYDLTDDEVREEIFCDNMKTIAERNRLMQKIANSKDKTLIERFVSWLKSMFDKFVSYFHNPKGGLTRTQLDTLSKNFGKSIRSAKDANGNSIFRYGNTTHVVQYADGRELPSSDNRYSFAGTKALTANQKALATAKRMEKSGKSRDDIFYETGWVKGRDGKWRFEIPDNLDKIDFAPLGRHGLGYARLEQIYDNPELYQAYPQLKDIDVYAEELEDDIGGQVEDGDIILNTKYLTDSPEDVKSFLVHELQHVIQHYEDFSSGGNPQTAKRQLQNDLNKILKEVEKNPNGEKYFEYLLRLDKGEKITSYGEHIKSLLEPKKRSRVEKLAEKFIELRNAWADKDSSALDLYYRLGGEQEAREVQDRASDYTDLVRAYGEDDENRPALAPPIIHDEDALIIFGGKKYAMASMKNPIDNNAKINDNVSEKIFDKYFKTEAQKDVVRNKVSEEIAQYVDISKMSDPVARDEARDKLPYIKDLLTKYNQTKHLNIKPEHRDFLAVKIEYARRCFDNDERIRNEAIRQVDGNTRQEGIHRTDNETVSRSRQEKSGADGRRIGVSRNVSGEKHGAYEHFVKLYDKEAGKHGLATAAVEDNIKEHSDNEQGAFSNVKYSIGDSSNRSEEKWLRRIWKPIAKKFGIDGDKIVKEEDIRERRRIEQHEAIEDFLKDPSSENRKRCKELGVTAGQIDARKRGEEYHDDLGAIRNYGSSPSALAKRIFNFRAFYRFAKRAMIKIVSLRDSFSRQYARAMENIKNEEERKDLEGLLWIGDVEGKDYSVLTDAEREEVNRNNPNATFKDFEEFRIKKIMNEAGVNENVAKAYAAIRRMVKRAYNLTNAAKNKVTDHSRHLSEKEIEELKNDKFIEIQRIDPTADADGKRLVSYRAYPHRSTTYDNLTQDAVDRMKNDKSIQVLDVEKAANGTFSVKVREGFKVNERVGYIPHYFHEFFISVRDKDGKAVETYGISGIIGSGRTERESVQMAEEWKKSHTLKEGEEIYITHKVANFGKENEKDYAVLMGDKDYARVTSSLAKKSDLTLAEVKELMNGTVKLKNRHRFLGNLLKRKGVGGYEKEDMDWVLRHYFNSVSRYVALETEFKPQAISLFERMYGSIERDWSGNTLAQYTKDFINDVNGTPTHLETMINKLLNDTPFFRNFLTPIFGDRAALTLATKMTSWTGVLTLGVWNTSSALLNYSQLINAGGYLGDYGRLLSYAGSIAKRAAKYKLTGKPIFTQRELRILQETGTLSDIGLDTSTGYDKNRSSATSKLGYVLSCLVGSRSLWMFKAADSHCRLATTLAAYDKAIAEGKTHREAIAYAQDINTKANFSYGVEDAPNILRRGSVISKIAGQFQKYPIKQIGVINDFLSKRTTWQQKCRFWIPYLLATGLMGVPALNWLDDLLKKLTGYSIKDELQKILMEKSADSDVGKEAAKIAMYGVGAVPILGIDMSSRVGMSDIQMPSLGGALFNKAYGAISNTAKGDYMSALRSVSPGAWNIVTAFEGESTGARGRKNDVYDTTAAFMRRIAGFKSVDEAVEVDQKRILDAENTRRSKERQKVIDALVADPYDKEAQEKAQELGIKPEDVKAEKRNKGMTRRERMEGSMPKWQRQDYDYMLRFAQ